MKTDELIIYGALVLMIGIVLYSATGMLTKENQQGVVQGQQYKTVTTGTTESGDVEIALTPQWKEGKLYINLAANTHSIDLSQFDLQQQATLSYNNKEIKPAQVPRLVGHHNNAFFIFNLDEQPKTFTIIVKGIPAVPERVYVW